MFLVCVIDFLTPDSNSAWKVCLRMSYPKFPNVIRMYFIDILRFYWKFTRNPIFWTFKISREYCKQLWFINYLEVFGVAELESVVRFSAWPQTWDVLPYWTSMVVDPKFETASTETSGTYWMRLPGCEWVNEWFTRARMHACAMCIILTSEQIIKVFIDMFSKTCIASSWSWSKICPNNGSVWFHEFIVLFQRT